MKPNPRRSFKVSLAQTIWQAANRGHAASQSTVNLSAVARRMRLRVPTLWGYHHGKVAWPADTWLAALLLTGAAKVENGALVVPLPDGAEPPFAFAAEALRKLLAHELGDKLG
jgi:hypothetical protein